MGLLDTLNELSETPDEVVLENGEVKDTPTDTPEEEKPEAGHPEEEKAEEESEEKPEEQSNPDKEKVSGYQRRRTKEFEEQLSKANEEREYFRKQNEQMQQMMQQLMAGQSKPNQESQKKQAEEIDPNTDPEGWLIDTIQKSQKGQADLAETIKNLQFQMTMNSARQELSGMESEYAKANQDYYDVLNHAFEREVAKQKYLNPQLTEQAIRAQLDTEKVQLAAKFAQDGKNPVDAMYNYMVSVYGKPQKQQTEAEKPKVDTFEAVKKNKAKSATSLSAGGRGSSGNALTKEHANGLSLSDFARLSAEDKNKIYAG